MAYFMFDLNISTGVTQLKITCYICDFLWEFYSKTEVSSRNTQLINE